ncbi:MAG: PEP-CTERM sorting domain-containing protein [Myxococcota bacterium]|nr:PEP-CTERM sorting domain-containing protein [Myxococcota bacterium]
MSSIGSPDPWAYDVGLVHDATTGNNLAVTVRNTHTNATTGALNYAVDLSALDTATFGWSAQTGGHGENHDVVGFHATFAVPEPSTGLLLGLGLLGLSGRGRRQR